MSLLEQGGEGSSQLMVDGVANSSKGLGEQVQPFSKGELRQGGEQVTFPGRTECPVDVLGTPKLRTKGDSAIEIGYEQPGDRYLRVVNRSAKEWLTFDGTINESPVRIFADSGASHRYMAMQVANRLRLPMSEIQGSVSLEGGKKLSLRGIAHVRWSNGSFQEYAEFYMLDMENDVILGEDFWIKYKATPDYDSYGLKIHDDAGTHVLSGIGNRFRIRTIAAEQEQSI